MVVLPRPCIELLQKKDGFHRKMKRRVLWVLYPNIMSNEEGEIIVGKRSEEIERRRSKIIGDTSTVEVMDLFLQRLRRLIFQGRGKKKNGRPYFLG